MSVLSRRDLRRMLATEAPWLIDGTVGPTTVDAQLCGRCRTDPGIVPVCGPVAFQAACPSCVTARDDLFCDGHQDVAAYARTFSRALPANWREVVLLWWIATGELRVDAALQFDAVTADPAAQRVGVDELVRRNAELLGARHVLFPVVDE